MHTKGWQLVTMLSLHCTTRMPVCARAFQHAGSCFGAGSTQSQPAMCARHHKGRRTAVWINPPQNGTEMSHLAENEVVHCVATGTEDESDTGNLPKFQKKLSHLL